LVKSPRCPAAAAPTISQTKRISVFLDKVPSGSSRDCAHGYLAWIIAPQGPQAPTLRPSPRRSGRTG
jgi:hypothetical protein